MSPKLSEEEFIKLFKEKIEKHEQTRDTVRRIGHEISIKSIENLRKWVFEVVTISSAILGVFIAVGSDSSMVKHKDMLSYAFFFFVSSIIYGFYKLKRDTEIDLDKGPKIINEICERQTRIINAEKEFLLERTKEAYDKVQRTTAEELEKGKPKELKEKISYDLDIIFCMFLAGLTLIGFSIRYRFGALLFGALLFFIIKFCLEGYNYYKGKKQK